MVPQLISSFHFGPISFKISILVLNFCSVIQKGHFRQISNCAVTFVPFFHFQKKKNSSSLSQTITTMDPDPLNPTFLSILSQQ